MDYQKFISILKGNFNNIPKEKSKAVRIFLSSTFADTHTERDHLIENVYPKLKKYCKSKYGLEFQVFDMRWGISHEITNSHATTTVCLNEIKNCQKNSVGPNFIAFLGNRYGSRCLPTRIKSDEYEILKDEIKKHDDIDLNFEYKDEKSNKIDIKIENLFEFCYELDDNEQPARYRLKHIDKIINDYNQKDPLYNDAWNKIETQLGNILRNIADICLEKNLINKVQHERYFVSVTEKEIFNGILTAKNLKNNVLYFEREIVDLEEKINENVPLARRFIELDEKKNVDIFTKNLLNDLKYKKIPSVLSESNMFKFKVNWCSKTGVSLKSHSEYVKNFAETFYEQVKLLIDRNQEQDDKFNNLSKEDLNLLLEVLDHAQFCNETVEKFHGRNDILERIHEYILDNENNQPFMVHGESGCGKTAILAKITDQILKTVPDPNNYVVILRFLGTSPASSSVYNTFSTITRQLATIFKLNLPNKVIIDRLELIEFFKLQLIDISIKYPDKKLVFILDSIDQLSTNDYDLKWILYQLPTNTKMIYSSITKHGSIVDLFQENEYLKDKLEKNFIYIQSLDKIIAKTILKDWLNKSSRSLSNLQWDVLDKLLNSAKLYPLFVKLIFDIVSKWTSFFEPDKEFKECFNIDKCIIYLFNTLEKIHGKMLFRRTIIYMSTFKNGISEGEIEDILSLDDDLLYDIFEFHAPPVRKLPIALWVRIKNDLNNYMVEKEVHDTRVIYWYHRRFIEVANSYYISKLSSDQRVAIFSNVIDFYNETWKNKPKPYKYNEYIAKKLKLESNQAQEKRDTSIQPTIFIDTNGNIKFNKRKINELPSFINQLTANLAIVLACEYVFFDFYFLTGMFYDLSIQEIFQELQKSSESSSYNLNQEANSGLQELKLLTLIFLQCGNAMKDNWHSALLNMISRSLYFYNSFKSFTRLIDQYYNYCYQFYPLILTHQYIEASLSDIIFQLDKHTLPITHSAIGEDNDRFVFTLSNKLHLFDMNSVTEIGEIKLGINVSFKFFLVYVDTNLQELDNLKLNNIQGGFIVATNNELKSYRFDSRKILDLKLKDDREILDVYIISKNKIVLGYKNENRLDFYNFLDAKFEYDRLFDSKILNLNSTSHKKYINNFCNLSSKNILLSVLLETNEVNIFNFLENDDINLLFKIPNPGLNVKSIYFAKKNNYDFIPTNINLTLENGCMIELKECYEHEQVSLSFSIINSNQLFDLKLIETYDNTKLYLASDGSLLFYTEDKIIEIDDKFDYGFIMSEKRIVGIQNGNLVYYLIKYIDQNYYNITKEGHIEAHFDDITFFFIKDQMLLTTSMDSTLKVFISNNISVKDEIKYDFDKTEEEVKELVNLEENYLISELNKSNILHIWKKSEGKKVETLKLDSNEHIEKTFTCFEFVILVIRSNLDSKEIKIHIYKINKDFKFILENKFKFDSQDYYKTFFNQSKQLFVLFTESAQTSEIKSHKLDIKNGHLTQTDFDLKFIFNKLDGTFLLKDSCLSLLNNLLILFYDHKIVYIDSKNGSVLNTRDLNQMDINMQYFLSPTNIPSNIIQNLTPIDSTDNLACISNLNDLILIEYSLNSNRIRLINSNLLSKDNYATFKANKNFIASYDKINSKLVCFNSDLIFKLGSFSKQTIVFKIDLNKSSNLNFYGFSLNNDYFYSIENRRYLKLFKLNSYEKKFEIKLIAELLLYTQVKNVLCSSDFISFSMQDRKIISYLIVEQNNLKDYQAKSFYLPDKSKLITDEIKAKNNLILEKYINILDESSDEEVDLDNILDEKISFFNFYFIKQALKKKEFLKLITKNLNLADLVENWAINILESEFRIKQKPKNIEKDDNIIVKNLDEDNDLVEQNDQNESYKKELSYSLVKNSNKEVKTLNTGMNVSISNSYPNSSKACNLQ